MMPKTRKQVTDAPVIQEEEKEPFMKNTNEDLRSSNSSLPGINRLDSLNVEFAARPISGV
jgi:hypothetical protein